MRTANWTHSLSPRQRLSLAVLGSIAWVALRSLGHGLARVAEVGTVWLERSRQRRALAELNDHMLRDIGLTRADAWAEAEKPFWRP
jgi:uncharacterized protein YjiS (DUF1127 family)